MLCWNIEQFKFNGFFHTHAIRTITNKRRKKQFHFALSSRGFLIASQRTIMAAY